MSPEEKITELEKDRADHLARLQGYEESLNAKRIELRAVKTVIDQTAEEFGKLEATMILLKGRANLGDVALEEARQLLKAAGNHAADLVADLEDAQKKRDGWHERCKELIAREPSEEDRQMMILSFAKLSVERPGWDYALNLLSLKWDDDVEGRARMYDQFRDIHKDDMTPEQWSTLLRAASYLRRALRSECPAEEGVNHITVAQNEILKALPEKVETMEEAGREASTVEPLSAEDVLAKNEGKYPLPERTD